MPEFYVYIMTNLQRSVYEHKPKLVEGFTAKYNITRLVYYEATPDVRSAITREKQIKGWLRSKKIALIESMNPQWQDLSEGWYEAESDPECGKTPLHPQHRDPSLRSG